MSFVDRSSRYNYMPPGSYAVLPDGKPFFRTELPEEIKERFTRDLKEAQEKQRELMKDPQAYPW